MSLTGHENRLPALLKRFKTQRPKWVDPSVFLNPALQNLFAMSYFKESHGGVPTGWQSVQDTGHYDRLSTRAPKKDYSSDVEMRSPNAIDGSDESGSEDASSEQVESVTRMADESSEGSDTAKGIVSQTTAAFLVNQAYVVCFADASIRTDLSLVLRGSPLPVPVARIRR